MSILENLKQYVHMIYEGSNEHRFRFATTGDVVDMIKKKYDIMPVDKFEYLDGYSPDELLPSWKVSKLIGAYGEKREWRYDNVAKLAMFGNYTMKDWYEFLVDIATNGLKESVLLSSDGSEVVEGNHRIQALRQLGHKTIPVKYER
jgi:hypothetical protein